MVSKFTTIIPFLKHMGYKEITDDDGWSYRLILYRNNTYYVLNEDETLFYVVNKFSPYCNISKIPKDLKNINDSELEDYTFNYQEELDTIDSNVILNEVISFNRKKKIKNII